MADAQCIQEAFCSQPAAAAAAAAGAEDTPAGGVATASKPPTQQSPPSAGSRPILRPATLVIPSTPAQHPNPMHHRRTISPIR